jgi:hypothetical protein
MRARPTHLRGAAYNRLWRQGVRGLRAVPTRCQGVQTERKSCPGVSKYG